MLQQLDLTVIFARVICQGLFLNLRGADQTFLVQLIRLPWHRQLELCEDNSTCHLPGLVVGDNPSENLLWVLVGFDVETFTYPQHQRFNSEDAGHIVMWLA